MEFTQSSFDQAPVVGAFGSLAEATPAEPVRIKSPDVARVLAIRARDIKRFERKQAAASNAVDADDRKASRVLVYRIAPEPVPEPERAPARQGAVTPAEVKVVRAGRAAERVKMARAINESAGREIIAEGP